MAVETAIVAWGSALQLRALARAGDSALPYSEDDPSLADHGAYISIKVSSPTPPEVWLDMQTTFYDALYWVARWAGPGRERGGADPPPPPGAKRSSRRSMTKPERMSSACASLRFPNLGAPSTRASSGVPLSARIVFFFRAAPRRHDGMATLPPPRAAARTFRATVDQLVDGYGLAPGKNWGEPAIPDAACAETFFVFHEARAGDVLIAKFSNEVPAHLYFAWDGHRAHEWDRYDDRIVPERYPVRYWAHGKLAHVLHEALVDIRSRRDELLANLRFGLPSGAQGFVYSPLDIYGDGTPLAAPGAYVQGRCVESCARPGEFIRGARGCGWPRGFVHTTFAHGGADYCLVLEEHGTTYGPPDEDIAALLGAFQGVLSRKERLEVSVSGDLGRFKLEPEVQGRFLPWWGTRPPTCLYYALPPDEYPPNLDLAGAVPWRVKSWLRWDELGHDDPTNS